MDIRTKESVNLFIQYTSAIKKTKVKDVYIELSTDLTSEILNDVALNLNKILYGKVEDPHLWYEKIKMGLK